MGELPWYRAARGVPRFLAPVQDDALAVALYFALERLTDDEGLVDCEGLSPLDFVSRRLGGTGGKGRKQLMGALLARLERAELVVPTASGLLLPRFVDEQARLTKRAKRARSTTTDDPSRKGAGRMEVDREPYDHPTPRNHDTHDPQLDQIRSEREQQHARARARRTTAPDAAAAAWPELLRTVAADELGSELPRVARLLDAEPFEVQIEAMHELLGALVRKRETDHPIQRPSSFLSKSILPDLRAAYEEGTLTSDGRDALAAAAAGPLPPG